MANPQTELTYQQALARAEAKLAELWQQGRRKPAVFQRTLAEILMCQNLLSRFALYGFYTE